MRLYGIVQRLKRLGAETKEAVSLNLLDLKQLRQRRLAYLRIQATDTRYGRFKNK